MNASFLSGCAVIAPEEYTAEDNAPEQPSK